MSHHQARLATPFSVLGIVIEEGCLAGIEFLPCDAPPRDASDPIAQEACRQLRLYLLDPGHRFDLPLRPKGTAFQQEVWGALLNIPCGENLSYGALAGRVGSSPRAVGQACGANPIPIVIPCHRVLGARGLGGFMNHSEGGPLLIKRWLLNHEHAERRPAG